jgi:midasin (ATPase involved in ribosome maturation)
LELTVDQKKINNLQESIKKFINNLIEIKYLKIAEIIVESELLDISRIQTFLENEKEDFYSYSEDIVNEYEYIKAQLSNLIGIKKTHFNFKLSALVNAMKDGDWVLLDDINFAPQEIEGLMSLLEEEPTLKIYENDPVLFFTKDKLKIRNQDSDFLIHPNFRIIMTTSKDTNISSAIKSRCLCIQIKPFQEPKDYGDLIANNLKYSDIADNNIIDVAKKIGYGFYKLKQEEEQSNYILRNYILSSVNLVNLSKMIIFDQPIDDKKLSQSIDFCFFSAFKKCNKKKEIIESFKKNLQKEVNMEIFPIRNIKRSHE